jgi:hypothetical protein
MGSRGLETPTSDKVWRRGPERHEVFDVANGGTMLLAWSRLVRNQEKSYFVKSFHQVIVCLILEIRLVLSKSSYC